MFEYQIMIFGAMSHKTRHKSDNFVFVLVRQNNSHGRSVYFCDEVGPDQSYSGHQSVLKWTNSYSLVYH